MGAVLALVLAIGLFPMPLINMTEGSVTALSERLQTSRIAMETPAPETAQLAQAD